MATQTSVGGTDERPTFKWSRDNGSVSFPVASVSGPWVTLAALGRDDKLDLHVGNWVELLDDAVVGRGVVSPLLQVVEIDPAGRRVRLSPEPAGAVSAVGLHPYLRRWDHTESRRRGTPRLFNGALDIKEGQWIDLEDGVQVWFRGGGRYRGPPPNLDTAHRLDQLVGQWSPVEQGGQCLQIRQPAGAAILLGIP